MILNVINVMLIISIIEVFMLFDSSCFCSGTFFCENHIIMQIAKLNVNDIFQPPIRFFLCFDFILLGECHVS